MILDKATQLLMQLEGFSAKSYWDYKQYTWGFGTKAPGKDAVISRQNATAELQARLKADLLRIQSLLKKPVSENAQVALLSFGYNAGIGAAQQMVSDINAGKSMAIVAARMSLYVNAGGRINDDLVKRRQTETSLLIS